MTRPGEAAVGRIREALAHEARLLGPLITITMLDDRVCLGGIVETPEQAQLALDVARQAAPGVVVENDVTVGMAPGESDRELAEEAGRRLAALHLTGVGVEVRGGTARLHGRCHTLAERQRAVQAVARIRGLRGVDDRDWQVAPHLDADDTSLADLARKRLMDTAPELAGELAVHVADRVATLRGAVRHPADARAVEDLVRRLPGIRAVINRLMPYQAGAAPGTDGARAEAIRRALHEAPARSWRTG